MSPSEPEKTQTVERRTTQRKQLKKQEKKRQRQERKNCKEQLHETKRQGRQTKKWEKKEIAFSPHLRAQANAALADCQQLLGRNAQEVLPSCCPSAFLSSMLTCAAAELAPACCDAIRSELGVRK